MALTMAADIGACITRSGMARHEVLNVLVAEAFMRRAATVNGPFALKGSLVLRQYLPDPDERIPGDMDWIAIGGLDEKLLGDWTDEVTAVDLDDGVAFRRFSENRFWRMMDYAMDEDFPTVNTDLFAHVNGEPHELRGMDVTYGLKLDPPPIPLSYRAMDGSCFDMPATCSLELQVAWKLHQSMVRPRFKDLVDLLWLLKANPLDVVATTGALLDECVKDKVPVKRLAWLLEGTLAQHPLYTAPGHGPSASMAERYASWRAGAAHVFEPPAKTSFRRPDLLPATVTDLLAQLGGALRASRFQLFSDTPPNDAETRHAASPGPSQVPAASTQTATGLWERLKRWL